MVLPIIIGIGVTVAALSLKSGIGAWKRYEKLTSTAILAMNGVSVSKMKQEFRNQPDHELRLRFAQFPGGFNHKMTENEALAILNITRDEILHVNEKMLKRKHRQCMLLNHPDKGGSPYLAMKINQAKELLDNSYLVRK